MKICKNGVWEDYKYPIYGTETDTITTLPAEIIADGNNATVGLVGSMVQTGAPTPQNPIEPSECGERTGNLADLYGVNKTALNLTFRTTDTMKIVIDGTKGSGANVISIKVPNITVPAGTYTVKIKMTSGSITGLTSDGVFFGINASTYGQRTTPAVTQIGEVGTRTFTLSEDTTITSFDITPSYSSFGAVFDNATFECWFYAGSDNKPYEPYGIKIPILSGGTTTPVYLGEVQTTRRIKKLVFDGTEEWQFYSQSDGTWQFYTNNLGLGGVALSSAMSNIAPYGVTATTRHRYDYGCYLVTSGNSVAFQMKGAKDTFTNITEWKAYLAAQYANGTPVTVWYVLATPETGILNEPIRKIGDYADTVSGITVPTLGTAEQFDVGTTLKPSSVDLTYHGWHRHEPKKRENGEWV